MRLRYLDAVFDGDPGERVKLGNGMFYVSPQIGRRRRRRRLEMWRGRIGKTHCRRRRRRRHWIGHKPNGGIIRCWLIQELIYRRIIFRNWFSVDQNLIFCPLSLSLNPNRTVTHVRWGEVIERRLKKIGNWGMPCVEFQMFRGDEMRIDEMKKRLPPLLSLFFFSFFFSEWMNEFTFN